MYETLWWALFPLGLILLGTALWGPDPVITVFASAFTIPTWLLLAFGATNYEVLSNGTAETYHDPGIALLFGALGVLGGVVGLFVGIQEWRAEHGEARQPGDDRSPFDQEA